jgi:hypothetical protein
MRRPPARLKTHSIPITAQRLFIAERQSDVEKAHPDLTRVQMLSFINDEWAQLDTATRAEYERRADYLRRTESRRRSLQCQTDIEEDGESKITPYSMFVQSHHEVLKRTNPEMTVGERATAISKIWTGMSHAERLPYVNEAKRETRRLRTEPVEEEAQHESDEGRSDSSRK